MGALTRWLISLEGIELLCVETDQEAVEWLRQNLPGLEDRILHQDFLKAEPGVQLPGMFGLIGNFPYNISNQIMFKVLEHRDCIPEVVGMFQKEVADRLCSPPGSKTYGILSVLLQAWYEIEILFHVKPGSFRPAPKVTSTVIRLQRNQLKALSCDERLFTKVVKAGFNQRRKTLRNALKSLLPHATDTGSKLFDQRAEQLSVSQFVELTNLLDS